MEELSSLDDEPSKCLYMNEVPIYGYTIYKRAKIPSPTGG
ncbi:hypothetical protein PMI41_02174 [Phyllobacterium sp. YR531]|nr:hypothetical protein PMI41_02174 [Phyllobacterium sp. YR531]